MHINLLELNCKYCNKIIEETQPSQMCENCSKEYHNSCLRSHFSEKLKTVPIPLYFRQYDYRCMNCKKFLSSTPLSTISTISSQNSITIPIFLIFLHLLFSFGIGIFLDVVAKKSGYFIHFTDYFSDFLVNGIILTTIILSIIYTILIPEIYYSSIKVISVGKNNSIFYLYFFLLLPVYITLPLYYEYIYKRYKINLLYNKINNMVI